jgi:hypothetical protein
MLAHDPSFQSMARTLREIIKDSTRSEEDKQVLVEQQFRVLKQRFHADGLADRSAEGKSFVAEALARKHAIIAEFLLREIDRADVTLGKDDEHLTLAHLAAFKGCHTFLPPLITKVKQLYADKPDEVMIFFSQKTFMGNTALSLALCSKDFAVESATPLLELAKEYKAEQTFKIGNHFGETALHCAMRWADTNTQMDNVIVQLLPHSELHTPTNNGITAFAFFCNLPAARQIAIFAALDTEFADWLQKINQQQLLAAYEALYQKSLRDNEPLSTLIQEAYIGCIGVFIQQMGSDPATIDILELAIPDVQDVDSELRQMLNAVITQLEDSAAFFQQQADASSLHKKLAAAIIFLYFLNLILMALALYKFVQTRHAIDEHYCNYPTTPFCIDLIRGRNISAGISFSLVTANGIFWIAKLVCNACDLSCCPMPWFIPATFLENVWPVIYPPELKRRVNADAITNCIRKLDTLNADHQQQAEDISLLPLARLVTLPVNPVILSNVANTSKFLFSPAFFCMPRSSATVVEKLNSMKDEFIQIRAALNLLSPLPPSVSGGFPDVKQVQINVKTLFAPVEPPATVLCINDDPMNEETPLLRWAGKK